MESSTPDYWTKEVILNVRFEDSTWHEKNNEEIFSNIINQNIYKHSKTLNFKLAAFFGNQTERK